MHERRAHLLQSTGDLVRDQGSQAVTKQRQGNVIGTAKDSVVLVHNLSQAGRKRLVAPLVATGWQCGNDFDFRRQSIRPGMEHGRRSASMRKASKPQSGVRTCSRADKVSIELAGWTQCSRHPVGWAVCNRNGPPGADTSLGMR